MQGGATKRGANDCLLHAHLPSPQHGGVIDDKIVSLITQARCEMMRGASFVIQIPIVVPMVDL